MNQNKITVIAYSPLWPKQFEQEAKLIRSTLGDNCLALHHIGSTSIPGMAAKPKIDMLGVVRDPVKAIAPLEAIGHIYKGEWNIPLKYGFNKRVDLWTNLHVFEEGHPEIELNLMFRDYLRSHAEARETYAQLKETLLNDPESHRKVSTVFTGYNLGKDTFIKDVLKASGFNRLRFTKATHYGEWEAIKSFNPHVNPQNHNQEHVVIYQGVDVIGCLNIQLNPESKTYTVLSLNLLDTYETPDLHLSIEQFILKWMGALGYKL